jgi:glycerol-3-phosphate acyltransferase PlsY
VTTFALLVAAVVGGYLTGSVSPAVFVARTRKVDVRSSGSGNPGATNVGRLLGVRWGVLVALLDVAKGAVPAWGFSLADERLGLLAGAAAVVGHVTSPFLRGRGGKGVATAFGAVLGVAPWWALILLVVFVVVVAATRWVALGSMSTAVALVAVTFLTDTDVFHRTWAVFLAMIILARHRRNVVARWRTRRVLR